MRKVIAAAAFAVVAGFAGAATAGPLSGPAGKALDSENLATPVATYVCTRDDRGWHYMRGSNRVTCRPVRPRGADWGWRCEGPRCGWWHRHNNRWHDAG